MSSRVLIVGGGSIGERHLRCFQQVGAEVALCENFDERRADVAARYGLKESFATVEAATVHPWDAVVICTPAHLHVRHVAELAPHTPALLIEKPLTTRLEELPQLHAAVQGKIAGIAYVLRCHPAVQTARDLVRSGAIGQLLQVNLVQGQHFPTFRPAYRTIYYNNRATGGGCIQDAATHMVDMVHYLAGPFAWIFCDYGHQALEGVEVEDTVHLTGRLNAGQTMASICVNQFMAPNEGHIQLNGLTGSILIRLHEQRVGLMRHGETEWTWTSTPVEERDTLFRIQAERFLAAAAGREPVVCTLPEAEHDLRVCLAALESNGQKRIAL